MTQRRVSRYSKADMPSPVERAHTTPRWPQARIASICSAEARLHERSPLVAERPQPRLGEPNASAPGGVPPDVRARSSASPSARRDGHRHCGHRVPWGSPREGALRRGKRKLEPQMHADEAGIDFGASAPIKASLTDRAGYRHQHAALCVHLRSSAVQILADSLPAMVVAACESRVILYCIH